MTPPPSFSTPPLPEPTRPRSSRSPKDPRPQRPRCPFRPRPPSTIPAWTRLAAWSTRPQPTAFSMPPRRTLPGASPLPPRSSPRAPFPLRSTWSPAPSSRIPDLIRSRQTLPDLLPGPAERCQKVAPPSPEVLSAFRLDRPSHHPDDPVPLIVVHHKGPIGRRPGTGLSLFEKPHEPVPPEKPSPFAPAYGKVPGHGLSFPPHFAIKNPQPEEGIPPGMARRLV